MNLAILVGTISSEIKRTEMRDGGSVTRFRVKTVTQYTQDGEIKERSQTHLIDVWNAYLQKEVTPLLKEGQMVEIQGSMEARNIARDNEPARWMHSIVLRNTGVINVHGGPGASMSVYGGAKDPTGPVRTDHHRRESAPVAVADDGLGDDVPF